MQIFCLVIGAVLTILFFANSLAGRKYADMVVNLDSGDFPLKSLYCVGFAWSAHKLFSLKGKLRETLVGQAKLLYGSRYAEYYANVAWAQFISFLHLSLALGFLSTCLMNSALMFIIFAAIGFLFGYYFLNQMNDKLKKRADACTSELPEVVSTMALLINAGMPLRKAWYKISESKAGEIYSMIRQSCSDMENGMSEVDAIHRFGMLSNSAEVRKFTSALAQGLERGGGSELNEFLARQSYEMWALKKQLMLQKGEAASSKLLAPTAMLFVAIIVAVLTGAFGLLI